MAAPNEAFRRGHHAGANGIENDVTKDLPQVALLLNQERIEPSLENVSHALVPAIEPLGVARVEPLHSARQCLLSQLDYEMVVI